MKTSARATFDSQNPSLCKKVRNAINFVRVRFPEFFPFIRPRNKICFVHYFPTDVAKCITIEKKCLDKIKKAKITQCSVFSFSIFGETI